MEHWIELAKRLEEAKFHGIFFADVLGIYDVYQGKGPALSSGAQIPHLDVSYMISAMAAVSISRNHWRGEWQLMYWHR